MRLENEIAVVTGASRGIGRAVALTLGAEGATVCGTATTEDGAEMITRMLAEQGVMGRGFCLDVTDGGAVMAVLGDIETRFGAPSILVNNAGITRDNLVLRMKEDEWDDVVGTNLTGVYRVTKGVTKGMMKARRGRIINISSVVARLGNAGQVNYCAAKSGVEGMTRALARELAPRGITVNAVAPGFIETDMTRGLSAEHRETLKDQIPLGRLGSAEDVAQAVVFLASPAGAYITGETLHVNGGMYMS
ncbi:MAG: 3-oxoacyl-ACP reductase FabG [Gammaproteobacteria bacterium]|nr:3-oxoacyl-ACP reductase FabG [Gammaproteobacteria bacterium]